MYQSILVPLDGSPFGEHALPLARSIARRTKATLQVVHVHEPKSDRLQTFYTLDPAVPGAERTYLQQAARRLAAQGEVAVDTVLLSGPVTDALQTQAMLAKADLLVMATHGYGPLSRAWLGSVADRLVRSLPLPILLVRPRETAPDLTREPDLRHILIPLDGSALAEQVIQPAVALGGLMSADYTLLRVIPPVRLKGFDPTGSEMYEQDEPPLLGQHRREADYYLGRVADGLLAQGLSVQTRVVVHPHAATAILEEAQGDAIDLLALATHGRGGLPRLLLGSVADKVLRGTSIPVLLYRPQAR
jgi:nucleotide-binding universal stress UspA family protein